MVSFSTCFLTSKEFSNRAKSQLSDVLKLLHQISLQCEDIRKVLHQSELCFLPKQTCISGKTFEAGNWKVLSLSWLIIVEYIFCF